MADADVLPYDYQLYGKEIVGYLEAAQKQATTKGLTLDFAPALAAANASPPPAPPSAPPSPNPPPDPAALNHALRDAEEALLNPAGLPKRPWYRHTIYAPGEFTGYAAVVIPGVNEAIDAPDAPRAQSQLAALTAALNRSAAILESPPSRSPNQPSKTTTPGPPKGAPARSYHTCALRTVAVSAKSPSHLSDVSLQPYGGCPHLVT